MKYQQGFYKPKYPEKFKYSKIGLNERQSKIQLPKYRSSYELQFFKFCDFNPKITEWSSEPFPIKYKHPFKNKISNYYIDFVIVYNGIKYCIEIKPYSQTISPDPKNLYAVMTYKVNLAKWDAARKYCEVKGWKFLILTEKQLFSKKDK
jgi:possible phage head completion protein